MHFVMHYVTPGRGDRRDRPRVRDMYRDTPRHRLDPARQPRPIRGPIRDILRHPRQIYDMYQETRRVGGSVLPNACDAGSTQHVVVGPG